MKTKTGCAVIAFIMALFLWMAVGSAEEGDTYYNYSFTCDAQGDCYWVYGDAGDQEEECPVEWNVFDEAGGTLLVHNVRMNMDNGLSVDVSTVIFWYDPLIDAFTVVLVEE